MWTVLLTFGRDENPNVLVDIACLRQETISGTSTLRTVIVDCLDAVEEYVNSTKTRAGDPEASPFPSPMSPTSPSSIQEMMLAFRRSSAHSIETEDSAVYATDEPDDQVGSDTTYHSSKRPMDDLDDGAHFSSGNPDRMIFERTSLKPAPLKLSRTRSKSKSRRDSPSPPKYSLFPPASPPPAKALPPIPSLKSGPKGLPPIPSPKPDTKPLPVVSPGPNSNAGVPAATLSSDASPKARERAFSDLTLHSRFSPPSSSTGRFSEPPRSNIRPPRSSSYSFQAQPLSSPRPETILSQQSATDIEIIQLGRLDAEEGEGSHGGVYAIETPSKATILASRHGKFHIKIWDLSSRNSFATIKVPFYVQIQPRSREYFIRSHAILSETHTLVGISTGFGQTLEIWNYAKRRKLQTLSNAIRWTAVRSDVYEPRCPPLATYSDDENAIKLYSVSPTAKKPFTKARVIDLTKAALPHLPKLPELAFSATGPLLVAAAGPRPPRPGNPPPAHSGLLMAWQLDDVGDPKHTTNNPHAPYKFLHTVDHPELSNSLPLALATYGSVAVSIWEAAKFRTFGKEGMWQVEPITITERVVLVWDFSGTVDRTSCYRIPATLACVSPDCRFVAYCDPGGRDGARGKLVVLDATRGGQELWRLDEPRKDAAAAITLQTGGASAGGRPTSRWSRKSSGEVRKSDRRSSGQVSSDAGSLRLVSGAGGLDALAADLKKVTELAFSGDGTRLFVGDSEGGIGVYEFRVDGPHVTMSHD